MLRAPLGWGWLWGAVCAPLGWGRLWGAPRAKEGLQEPTETSGEVRKDFSSSSSPLSLPVPLEEAHRKDPGADSEHSKSEHTSEHSSEHSSSTQQPPSNRPTAALLPMEAQKLRGGRGAAFVVPLNRSFKRAAGS